MNIAKLQRLVTEGNYLVSEPLQKRILDNELTTTDIQFLERTMTTRAIIQIQMDANNLYPVLSEGAMTLIEMKNAGETEVDIDYALNLLNDMTDYIMLLKDLTEDIGIEPN